MNTHSPRYRVSCISHWENLRVWTRVWLMQRQRTFFSWALAIFVGSSIFSTLFLLSPLSMWKRAVVSPSNTASSPCNAPFDARLCAHLQALMTFWKHPSQIARDLVLHGVNQRPDAPSAREFILESGGRKIVTVDAATLKMRLDPDFGWSLCTEGQLPDVRVFVETLPTKSNEVWISTSASKGNSDARRCALRKAHQPTRRQSSAFCAWRDGAAKWIAPVRDLSSATPAYSELPLKYRVHFTPQGMPPYSRTLSVGESVVWGKTRWQKCPLGPLSRQKPLARLESQKGDTLLFHLWDRWGYSAQKVCIQSTIDRLDRKCLRLLCLVGARSSKHAIVEASGKRALLKVGDCLVFKKNGWSKCVDSHEAENAQSFTLLELFCKRGQWRIKGNLRSAGKLFNERIEIGQNLPGSDTAKTPRSKIPKGAHLGLPRVKTRSGTPSKSNAARNLWIK